jgi:hypothetical protein
LRWFERHRRLDAAHCAVGTRLGARKTSRRSGTCRLKTDASPIEPALLTALWVVLKLFVEEKDLFPSSEDKFTTTTCAG